MGVVDSMRYLGGDMTKKHFRKLAYKLAMQEPRQDGALDESMILDERHETWQVCCAAVADACEYFSPRFSRGTFLVACHRDYWKNHKPPR